MVAVMKKKFLIALSFFLIGCASSTPEPSNEVTAQKQNNNYEFRIIEDPSTGILTAFYEKDGNLYYRQVTNAHTSGDNISLTDDGWTEMKPPENIEFKTYQ